jgi:hypothetical protein
MAEASADFRLGVTHDGGSTWESIISVDNNDGRHVGIGTTSPNEKLSVVGNVLAEEVIVKPQDQWADFVFEESYDLPTLKEVSSFIEEEGRLPDVPSKADVSRNGVHLGQMDATLLRKVEELTLYTIDQEKQLARQRARADSLAQRVDTLQKQLREERRARKEVMDRHQKQMEAMRKQLRLLQRRLQPAPSSQ